MNNKKYMNYFLGAALLATVSLSGIYTYLHLKMTSAYENKDYSNVYKYAKLISEVNPAALDIIIKSSIEEGIKNNLAYSSKTSFNPIIGKTFVRFRKDNYDISKIGRTSDAIMLYKAMIKSRKSGLLVTQSNSLAYLPLLTHAKEMNFRNKEYYITSCYLYPIQIVGSDFMDGIEDSHRVIRDLLKEKSKFSIYEKMQKRLENTRKANVIFLENQIKLLRDHNEEKTKLFYNFFEKEMEIILNLGAEELKFIHNRSNKKEHDKRYKEFIINSLYSLENSYNKLYESYKDFRTTHQENYKKHGIPDTIFESIKSTHTLYIKDYSLLDKSIDKVNTE